MAWPKAVLSRLVVRVVEHHVGASSNACGAGGTAVDLGGGDAIQKGAVGSRVSLRDSAPAGV